MATKAYGQNNNTDAEPPVSSFPEDLYSHPSARPTLHGQSHQEIKGIGYHSIQEVQKKKAKKIEPYTYADVTNHSPNTADTTHIDQGGSEAAGWADNSIYARTEETSGEDSEGWKGNDIYETSNREDGEEGWKDNNIYVTSNH